MIGVRGIRSKNGSVWNPNSCCILFPCGFDWKCGKNNKKMQFQCRLNELYSAIKHINFGRCSIVPNLVSSTFPTYSQHVPHFSDVFPQFFSIFPNVSQNVPQFFLKMFPMIQHFPRKRCRLRARKRCCVWRWRWWSPRPWDAANISWGRPIRRFERPWWINHLLKSCYIDLCVWICMIIYIYNYI